MNATQQHDTATRPDSLVDTRRRLVEVTARLLQQQGYEGTGIKQIAREAGAAFSSVYHFFPGGKRELAAAAIRYSDQETARSLRATLDSEEDPAEAVAATARFLADGLRASDWTEGCEIAATALETVGREPDIQCACDEAFHHWQEVVADRFRRAGIATDEADDLACTVINTLEGAELTAQVTRSDKPLLVAGRHLARLIRTYL